MINLFGKRLASLLPFGEVRHLDLTNRFYSDDHYQSDVHLHNVVVGG